MKNKAELLTKEIKNLQKSSWLFAYLSFKLLSYLWIHNIQFLNKQKTFLGYYKCFAITN